MRASLKKTGVAGREREEVEASAPVEAVTEKGLSRIS
jgi:hypothetical protein